jgi:hypothetical protein
LRRSLVIASLLTGKLLWTMGGRRNLYSSALPWRLFAFAQFLRNCAETPHLFVAFRFVNARGSNCKLNARSERLSAGSSLDILAPAK